MNNKRKCNYTKKAIMEECNKALKKIETFYNIPVVNETSKVADGNENIYDVVADFVIKNISKFNSIKSIERTRPYKIKSHLGETTNTNRIEENIAKKLLHHTGTYGRIEDYQIPLKSSKKDKGVGKIDLLSIDENNKIVYVLELKKDGSKETMLRCVLESLTYSKLINRKQFDIDYDTKNYKLKFAPLVFVDSEQYKEYKEKGKTYCLINKLEIKPFFIEKTKNGYKEKIINLN